MKAGIGECDLEARPRRRIKPQDRVDFLAQSLQHFGLRLIYDPFAWGGLAADGLPPHLVRCGGETISILSRMVNFTAIFIGESQRICGANPESSTGLKLHDARISSNRPGGPA